MKILVVCDHGNNRSVTLAHQLKYLGNDVLVAGVLKNSDTTLSMLYEWADLIIRTADDQYVPEAFGAKTETWNIGPDVFPRPFNPGLLTLVRELIALHPEVRQ